jgi:type II secretory pathway component HofQ
VRGGAVTFTSNCSTRQNKRNKSTLATIEENAEEEAEEKEESVPGSFVDIFRKIDVVPNFEKDESNALVAIYEQRETETNSVTTEGTYIVVRANKTVYKDETIKTLKAVTNLYLLVFLEFLKSDEPKLVLMPMFDFLINGQTSYTPNLISIFNALRQLEQKDVDKLQSRTIVFPLIFTAVENIKVLQAVILEDPDKYLIRE